MGMRRLSPSFLSTLALVGALGVLTGFFSPWVPHESAGLVLTGFELGEWIKFAPQVQSGAASPSRAGFYWPPVVAAAGLALGCVTTRRWARWTLLAGAVLLSLLPVPLLEEVNNWQGILASRGRIALTFLGLTTATTVWWRQLTSRTRGAALALIAAVGLTLVSLTFSAAEPIVEQLYNHLIDPGVGYQVTRGGMAVLVVAGVLGLFQGKQNGRLSIRNRPPRS